LDDFIIVDMPEIDTRIILGQPILATAGCHIDVKKGCTIFEVKGHHAMPYHQNEKVVSPHSSL